MSKLLQAQKAGPHLLSTVVSDILNSPLNLSTTNSAGAKDISAEVVISNHESVNQVVANLSAESKHFDPKSTNFDPKFVDFESPKVFTSNRIGTYHSSDEDMACNKAVEGSQVVKPKFTDNTDSLQMGSFIIPPWGGIVGVHRAINSSSDGTELLNAPQFNSISKAIIVSDESAALMSINGDNSGINDLQRTRHYNRPISCD